MVAATTGLQLLLAAAGLGPASALPWPALTSELAAWLAIAVAAGAAVARTRWTDLGGAIAPAATLGLIGMLAIPAWHLLPSALGRLAGAGHQHRAAAERAWWTPGAQPAPGSGAGCAAGVSPRPCAGP